ncbi:MAG: flagellar hook-length control protein FliK [Lachnospiraceae bacterium]|nr:flagellar hook-length control protein FliK [Lachnospiraceae bacterium]
MKIGQIANESMQNPRVEAQRAERTVQEGTERAASGFALELGQNNDTILGDKKKDISELTADMTDADAQNRQDMMTLMAHTVSPEAYGKMQEEGFDPREMDPEDAVNIVDEIKATMAKSGVVVSGYNDDLSAEQLEAITGSAVYAQEIERAFRENAVPLNEANAKEASEAVSQLTGLPELSEGSKEYMVENGLTPTLANVYRALHSGAAVRSAQGAYVRTDGYIGRTAAADAADLEQLKGQMEKLIERAGEEADEENLAIAKRLTEEGMPLTEESFLLMKQLDSLELPMSPAKAADAAARALSDGLHPAQADLTSEDSLLKQAAELTQTLQELPDEAADAVVAKDLPLTIKNLSREAKAAGASAALSSLRMEASIEITMETRTLTARRQLQEVRLSMTVQVSYHMLKTGVKVDTTELSDLVEQMKAAEAELLKSRYNASDANSALERDGIFRESMEMLRQIPGMPVSIIGDLLKADTYESTYEMKSSFSVTMEEYVEAGRARSLRYETVQERYETMQTQVRGDLGDSIGKAFSRAESLLGELGIDAGEDDLRAVRILGYNSMEISQRNIDLVKDACRTVDDIVTRMTPENTLQMIRDGKNPLKMGMDELDAYLTDTAATGESYSEFLVRMETKNRITAEERESYIGIHRMLHQIGKRSGAAIGSVLEQGAELTFANLLTAVRSRRDAGMDVTVDDSLQGMDSSVENDIRRQIETALYKDAASDLAQAAELPRELYEELIGEGIVPNADRLLGLRGLRERKGELFDLCRRAAGELHRRQHTTSDGRVVSGEEAQTGGNAFSVTEEILEEAVRDSLERFDSREEAQEAYSHLADVAENVLAEAALQEDGSIDLKAMAAAMKQLGTARALAEEESYEIPMAIAGTETTVNVRIRHEGERGRVEIRLEHASYGEMMARFRASGDGLSAYVACSTPEGRDAAAAMEDTLLDRMREAQIPMNEIDFVYSSHLTVNFSPKRADDINESYDTATLYKSAKIFLLTIGEA